MANESPEKRVNQAFQDLARRADAVEVDRGPHVADAKSGRAGLGGLGCDGPNRRFGGRPLIPALVIAALVAVAGFGGLRLLTNDDTGNNIATNELDGDIDDDSSTSDGNGSSDESDTTGIVGTITEVSGEPDLPFVLIETEDGTSAGFPSLLNSWVDLPADAQDAMPDGQGGVFYTTDTQIFHKGVGEERIEVAVGDRVDLIANRKVADRPAVLALVDNTIFAFFADGSLADLPLGEFDIGQAVEKVAIDGTTLAAITNDGTSRWVSTVSLLDERPVWSALLVVPADDRDAPRDIAVAGDRVIVGTSESADVYQVPAGVDSTTGSSINSFPLPASPLDDGWWSFDASGNGDDANLIIGFGESALTIDLESGDRAVVSDVDGWVRSAHWAFAPSATDDSVAADPGNATVGDRYRVDTTKVAADANDPFLNMRSGAGADQTLVAKLPPTYRGLRATGNRAQTDDGATWFEFELLHPVQIEGDAPDSSFDNPTGWVNSALTLPLNDGIGVGVDEVPGCFGGELGPIGGGLPGQAYVYGLESRYLTDTCLRVVLTLASDTTPFMWSDIPNGTGPAGSLPAITPLATGGRSTNLDLGRTKTAWPTATETNDDVYIVRGDNGNLQLVTPQLVGGANVTPLPDLGIVVIDLEVDGPAPIADQHLALTSEPLIGNGSVSVTGIARPFEATLGVSVVDANQQPVTAVFSGSSFLGTIESDEYGVSTNDWTEAWGRFAVKVDGLEPGQYTMLLDGQGVGENPVPTGVPFTITDGPVNDPSIPSDAEAAVAASLISFAQGRSIDDVPLADNVTLALGLDQQMVRTRAELADRDNWTFDVDGFGGFGGPFNVLETLDGPGGQRVEYSAGPMDFCAGPPKVWPAEWQNLDQINIEPIGIDSCIAWYGISFFLNGDGEIEVIVLDLYGP